MKFTTVENGYITGIGRASVGNISDAEYTRILDAIQSRPAPPTGYDCRLRTDLTWELVKMPTAPAEPTTYTEDELAEMTNAELEQILYTYGRTANMNKSNMIDLILHLQADKNSL